MFNDYEIEGDISYISFNVSDGSVKKAVVDTDVLLTLKSFNRMLFLSYQSNQTVVKFRPLGGRTTPVNLSRWILGVSDRRVKVDHINHDTLDVRRSNLIALTGTGSGFHRGKLNSNNSSGFAGVIWCKRRSKWVAQLRYKGRRYHLGYFDDKFIANEVIDKRREELKALEVKEVT